MDKKTLFSITAIACVLLSGIWFAVETTKYPEPEFGIVPAPVEMVYESELPLPKIDPTRTNYSHALPSKHTTAKKLLADYITKRKSTVDEESAFCLALNIYHESQVDTYYGKVSVSKLTMDRVRNTFYPGNVCDVIKQEHPNYCEFSWWCDGKSDRVRLYDKKRRLIVAEYEAWMDSIEIAVAQLTGRIDPVFEQATHYYNPKVCFGNSVKLKNHPKLPDGCHPKWAVQGFADGEIQVLGMYGMHLFLLETRLLDFF